MGLISKEQSVEILMQESLDLRGSIKLKVSVEVYRPHPHVKSYYTIPDSLAHIEVNSPGLAWRVVNTVKQALQSLAVQIEGENTNDRTTEQNP